MLHWDSTLVQQISYEHCIAEGLRHTYPVAEAPVEHNLVTKTDLCASERSVSIGSSQDTELVKHTHKMVRELFHYLTQVSAPSIHCYSTRMEARRQQKEAARKWLIFNDENTSGTPI